MKLFILGDVHGCFHTLKALVEEHWNPEDEFLIQLGDLVQKGPHSARCIEYAWQLQKEYPYQCFFLKGNHEQIIIDRYKENPFQPEVSKFNLELLKHSLSLAKTYKWLEKLPLKWENLDILITHAGISKSNHDPFDIQNPKGVLLNRSGLKALDKVQVIGHIVLESDRALLKTSENAWYIDTGAWLGRRLTGLKLNYLGEQIGTYYKKTDLRDLEGL